MAIYKCEDCGRISMVDDSFVCSEGKCPDCGGISRRFDDATPEEDGFIVKCRHCGEETRIDKRKAYKTFSCTKCGLQNDTFSRAWEALLGGYTFSAIISFAITLVGCGVVAFNLLQRGCLAKMPSSFLEFVLDFELVLNMIFFFAAAFALVLFFRRSHFFLRFGIVYWKTGGILVLGDLLLSLAVLDGIGESTANIERSIMSAFWCFFWMWMYKRLTTSMPVIKE